MVVNYGKNYIMTHIFIYPNYLYNDINSFYPIEFYRAVF
jgi:hypothetical protein